MRAYAEVIRTENPEFARDLTGWADEEGTKAYVGKKR